MEILNLGGAAENNSPAPKSRKKLRVLLGIGALAAVTGIGSTLAANISLNGGGNVEFGQGVATTAACDDDITLTPISEFSNTEEDATFAMTAIQISGIDLSPEGWDFSNNSWANGYMPRHWDESIDQYIDESWSGDAATHAGQYKNYNGEWTNTCANKSLMLRGYTDNSDYAKYTIDNNISSALMLNGYNYQRPNNDLRDPSGTNAGVGFRFTTYPSDNSSYWYASGYYNSSWDIADNDTNWSDGCNTDATYVNRSLGGTDGDLWNDSSVTIYTDDDSWSPPLDSRWVDKLTVESAAQTPSGWCSDN